MSLHPSQSFFESALRQKIAYNTENRIAPSESALANRMLNRGLELKGLYVEAYEATTVDLERHIFLNCCALDIGLCWTEADGRQAREDKKRLSELNAEIAKRADELADLMQRRTAINERGSFLTNHTIHILDVLDEAGQSNGLFRHSLHEPLDQLRGRFDFKYWPKLDEIVRAIGVDASQVKVEAMDPLTAAMCESTRPSRADVVRAIQASIEANKRSGLGSLPKRFKLSNDALASLANVLLDLPAEKLLDARDVKNIGARPLKRRKA